MARKYTVLSTARAASKEVKPGDTVFACTKYDYGIARDDTNATGVEHISVTFDPEGDYPFFTIPVCDLKEQQHG